MSKYVLPDLTYDYGSLEPNISGKIMELHHESEDIDAAVVAVLASALEIASQRNLRPINELFR